MAQKMLDNNGLLYLWQKIRTTFVSDVVWDSTNKKLQKKKKTGTSGAEETTDLVTFSTVATTGSYSDLSNKPTIPAAVTIDSALSNSSENPVQNKVINSALGEKAVGNGRIFYGSCSTVESTAIKSVYCPSYDTFQDGDILLVWFTHGNTANPADLQLNVNSKGAKDIKKLDTDGSYIALSQSYIKADYLYMFVYHTNNTPGASAINFWVLIGVDTNTTYSNASGSAAGLMSSAHYTKLEGIAAGAEVNVQANWSESSSSSDAYIKNKPTLGAAAAKGTVSSISSDSDDLPTVTAVKQYVSTAVSGGAAFQGTAPTTFAPTNYKAGWYWVVGTAGTYVGETCEVGDMIFCTTNYSSAYSASDFDVLQTNLDIASISNAEIDTIVAS